MALMLLFCRTTNTTTHQQGWRVTHRPVTGVLPKVRFALIFLLTLTAPTSPLSDALLQLQCCFWVTNGIWVGNSCRNYSLLKSNQVFLIMWQGVFLWQICTSFSCVSESFLHFFFFFFFGGGCNCQSARTVHFVTFELWVHIIISS